MARVITFIDDYTGQPGGEDILVDFKFSIGGDRYAMDLAPESEAELRKLIAPFTDKARIDMRGGRAPASDNGVSSANPASLAPPPDKVVRAWAKTQPQWKDLSPTGKLANDVVLEYMAAMAAQQRNRLPWALLLHREMPAGDPGRPPDHLRAFIPQYQRVRLPVPPRDIGEITAGALRRRGQVPA